MRITRRAYASTLAGESAAGLWDAREGVRDMNRPSGSLLVLLAVGMVAASAFGVFNYSRYRDARDFAETQTVLRDGDADTTALVRDGDSLAAAREREKLARELDELRAKLAATERTRDEWAAAHRALRDELARLTGRVNGVNDQAVMLQTSRDSALRELDAIRKRNGQLEEERLRLMTERERADGARIAAEADNKQLRDRYEGKTKPATLVGAEGARGTVTGLDPTGGDLVTLSIGLDAALTRGAELDVHRPGGRGQYLGTVVVAEVGPKTATARFKPADGRAFKQLKADERPRVGDVVSKLSADGTGGR
jgi:hypothetical protein